MKVPKPKKPSRKSLVAACDRELSLSVREETPYCVTCGSRENLTCGHLFSRVAYSTRWLRENVATQCAGCNRLHEFNPHVFTLWFIRTRGLGVYEWLDFKYRQPEKFTTADLRSILESIRARRQAWAERKSA